MRRHESKRFKFDVENYEASINHRPMKHIKIYCEGAMQIDLWLDEIDVLTLKETLEDME